MQNAIVKTKRAEKPELPAFDEPTSLEIAESNIAYLGCNMAEHAYLIGRNLIWVKAQLKHGGFRKWIDEKVWFGNSTAAKFMRFAKKCKQQKYLLPYQDKSNVQNLHISNKPIEIKTGQYRTIIIDPPWPYGTQYDEDTRRVGSPYPEMTVEAIAATKFPFADDCILWLWTTHRFLPVSFELLESWGFDYKATLVWNKQKMGIGVWLRMQCEFCLLASKGNPVWKTTDTRDFISERGRQHSRKPEAFYKLVLKTCPEPIGEAFSRQKRKEIEIICGDESEKFSVE